MQHLVASTISCGLRALTVHNQEDDFLKILLWKRPHDRTCEDLEIIYEELLHIKALSHLSTMVKKELASVLIFESHEKAGTVLFNQGDEGKSWYIILKGSVNVVIYGKGVVCTLHEGDDFGKLALLNDAPRAATIVLREDNCHFLRVDKDDFNRILRDVEANTVRLKEHGQDVLVLEKIPTNTPNPDGTIQSHFKYSVMAGTAEKMLEYLLETRLAENKNEDPSDFFLVDFLRTHVIFMPTNKLCAALLSHYHAKSYVNCDEESASYALTQRRSVIQFVHEWFSIGPSVFKGEKTIKAFLEELQSAVEKDILVLQSLSQELHLIKSILQYIADKKSPIEDRPIIKRKFSPSSVLVTKKSSSVDQSTLPNLRQPIKPDDENIFKVYCADHTYSTLRDTMDCSVQQIVEQARDKLCLGEDLVLCEVKSSGERVVFKKQDICVTTRLTINGYLFISPREHLDALTPLPEQEGPTHGTANTIELMSTKEIAYHMTLYDWELFSCLQEYELIYKVFGAHQFKKITANLELFLRRFNEVQYWIVTEMLLTLNVSKRVQLLRKFIKLAAQSINMDNYSEKMQQMADELVNKSYQLRGVFSNFSATVSSDDAAFFRKTSEDIRKMGQQLKETSKQIKDNASKQQKVDSEKYKKDRKEMAALKKENFSLKRKVAELESENDIFFDDSLLSSQESYKPSTKATVASPEPETTGTVVVESPEPEAVVASPEPLKPDN